jgi:hypothetical protein
VAVRVRPFNARETARNALNIVEMSGKSTKITNPQVKGGGSLVWQSQVRFPSSAFIGILQGLNRRRIFTAIIASLKTVENKYLILFIVLVEKTRKFE